MGLVLHNVIFIAPPAQTVGLKNSGIHIKNLEQKLGEYIINTTTNIQHVFGVKVGKIHERFLKTFDI